MPSLTTYKLLKQEHDARRTYSPEFGGRTETYELRVNN